MSTKQSLFKLNVASVATSYSNMTQSTSKKVRNFTAKIVTKNWYAENFQKLPVLNFNHWQVILLQGKEENWARRPVERSKIIMSKCARCSTETINGKLLCEDCLAKRRAEIAARAAKYQSGRVEPGSHYEPTPEEIAAGIAAIKARWSDAEYYHRAGVPLPNADTRVVDRGLEGRVFRQRFQAGG